MEIAADTTLLVDLWRCRQRPQRLVEAREKCAGHTVPLPWMTRAEFLRGAAHQGCPEAQTESFLSAFQQVAFTDGQVSRYARVWADLAKAGQIVDFPDLWIAATALDRGCPVITRNGRHFNRVPGLQVIEYKLI